MNTEPQEERGKDWLEILHQKVYDKDGALNFEAPEFEEYSDAMYKIGISGKDDPEMMPYLQKWEAALKKASRGFVISAISMTAAKLAIIGVCIWQGIVHDWTWWMWIIAITAILALGNLVASILTFPIRLFTKTTPQAIEHYMRLYK